MVYAKSYFLTFYSKYGIIILGKERRVIMSDEAKERHYRDTGLCKCRICCLTFNRSPETKDITWVMRQKGWYYHKECFEKRCQEIRELRDNDTADSLKDITWHYLKHIASIYK